MKHFTSVTDVPTPMGLIQKASAIKNDPFTNTELGKNKVMGLVFFNASLRTRMSTARAAYNLGMKVITLNVTADSWQLEFEDGVRMDAGTAEHIKEAVPVLCAYCDIIGVRSFPGLVNQKEDYAERVIHAFKDFGNCPIVNLESTTLHPLQSLTDMMTIEEYKQNACPKVVISWAPHIKPLPQAVANSFLQWSSHMDFDLTLTHPKGMELSEEFTAGVHIEQDQSKALEGADFVYVKNWSSFNNYGKIGEAPEWELTKDKLQMTNHAKLMHCLPVRRNVVISDDALNSEHSIVVSQAENRLYAAQAVLTELLNFSV
ncbi:MAG: acetylornithine carbamoyltransferase [Ekhidna sp.]